MKTKTDKLDLLIGIWTLGEDLSNCVFKVSKMGKRPKVSLIDTQDGETSDVSKVRWNAGRLSFNTYTRSTRWHTRSVFQSLSKLEILHEYTFWESLTRSPASHPPATGSRADWLIGKWESPDDSFWLAFDVKKTARGWKVRAFHTYRQNRELRVAKCKWDGTALCLDVRSPEEGWRVLNRLKAISKSKLKVETTDWEHLKKKPSPIE